LTDSTTVLTFILIDIQKTFAVDTVLAGTLGRSRS
jgi:hypothetical protein